ncbi:MAG: hypothetical protein IJ848_03905 [Alphaproteobacteria bacterium]|nr:hypothetical protein [Alphaproteobacteria bacterium]
MQKLNFILPKVIVKKVDSHIIKQCILDNWHNIIPCDIINFTRFNKILLNRKFQLKVFINILDSSIVIVKTHDKEIIDNIMNITNIENVRIIYQQVLNINNGIVQ